MAPIIAFDYGFMGSPTEGVETYPILVARDSRAKYTMATCVECKAATAHAVSFLVGAIGSLGYRKIILKCDNEPATKAVQEAVCKALTGVEVILSGPPEGDHRANGLVENAVKEIKRFCRTLGIASELKRGERISDDHPVMSWLPRYASQVMNRFKIGADRKSTEMRRSGRHWRKPVAQFGEKVWFRRTGEDGPSSFASRMTQ